MAATVSGVGGAKRDPARTPSRAPSSAGSSRRPSGVYDRADPQIAVGRGDPHALVVDRHDRARRHRRRGIEHGGVLDDDGVAAEHEADGADAVAQAMAEVEGADRPRRLGGGGQRVEEHGRPVVAAEHPALTRRLRCRGQRALGDRRGDARERRQGGLVAAGVERERRLVGGDGNVSLTTTSPASTSLVIRCQVMAWWSSPPSNAHVVTLSPAYPGSGPSWKLIAVETLPSTAGGSKRRLAMLNSTSAGWVSSAVASSAPGPLDGDAVLGGVVPDDGVRRGDEHDLEPVRPCRIRALCDERLVTDQHATHRIPLSRPLGPGQNDS